MEEHVVKLLSIEPVTHDVKRFRFEKPIGYTFTPGQATEVSIHKQGWEKKKRPFTFTSLNDDTWLEFTIKRYTDHHGVTDQLHQLVPGDELIIRDVWGAIEYKGAGYFIAGGAGITPFMAILRQLKKEKNTNGNVLFFSNKTINDIIYEKELNDILGKDVHFILSKDTSAGYLHGRVTKQFLLEQQVDVTKHFYVCGPDEMVKGITAILEDIGADASTVVFEK